MRKVLKVIFVLIGASLGAGLVALALGVLFSLDIINADRQLPFILMLLSYVIFSLLGALLFLLISPSFFKALDRAENALKTRPAVDLVAGAIGLCIGFFLAYLLSQLINLIGFPWLSIPLSVMVYLLLGYGGLTLAVNRRHEFNIIAQIRRAAGREAKASARETAEDHLSQKLLDTSVIIDGRIFEICKAGFLEGRLIVPSFVLDELRTISDSEDDLKRSRGRRGLDILARLQHELSRPVEVLTRDFPELSDVDSKLLKLAGETGAKVITNDYNLNKVAKVQNIRVLNINELSNAVKPIALPGEEMTVKIVKTGKEQGQGVAYLEDGTMIVVEGGSRCIDEAVQIMVTSSLQTSAGRMIFGKMV